MSPRLPCMIAVMFLSVVALENERGVGAAEAEGVGKSAIDPGTVDAIAHDPHTLEFRIKVGDMRTFADEALLHHQQRIDRFLNAGSSQRMSRQRLGRLDMRNLVAEVLADRADLLAVAD